MNQGSKGAGGTVTGGCLCGAVRYELKGEIAFAGHCHCEDCRRSSGSSRCSHAGVMADAVTMTGKTSSFDKPADSGNMVTRHFCPTCGAPVFSTNSAMPGMLFLRASSFDDLEVFTPQMTVYAARAPSWDPVAEGMAAFDAMPPGPTD
jgi:hypothetical protein